jgi:hypothetical protein
LVAQYVKQNASKVKEANKRGGHHGGGETIREADYAGHHIVVGTTYRVEVDGVPVTGHLGVTDDGQVHYHAVPNIAYASAIDLLKALIDIFPDDFGPGSARSHGSKRGGKGHGGRVPSPRVRRSPQARAASQRR